MTFSRLDRIPSIKAVMTPFPWSIDRESSAAEARALMRKQGIRHLPVTESGALVGLVTERDLALLENAERGDGPGATTVGAAALRESYLVETSEPLDRVLLGMAERLVDCALVLRQGKLVGIFTVTDACASFGELLRSLFPEDDGDQAA